MTCASVGLTIIMAVVGTGLPPSSAVPFVLAVMTAEASWFEPGGRAVALTALSGPTMVAGAVRQMVSSVGCLLAVFAVAFTVEVGLGVHLRWIDWRRHDRGEGTCAMHSRAHASCTIWSATTSPALAHRPHRSLTHERHVSATQ